MFCLFYKRMKLFAASREVSAGASPPGAAPPESIADVPTGSGASPAELYRQKINCCPEPSRVPSGDLMKEEASSHE